MHKWQGKALLREKDGSNGWNQLRGEYVGVVVGVIGEGPLALGPQALILGCAQLQLDYYAELA